MTADIIDKKEKLLLEYLISDRSVFVKCVRILRSSYFDTPLDSVAEFILEQFKKYHTIPNVRIIEAETGVSLEETQLHPDDVQYFLDTFEEHCRNKAMTQAILASVDHINNNTTEAIQSLVRDALLVKIDNSLGTDQFEDARQRIEEMDEAVEECSTGIQMLDDMIGNARRGEMGIFFAATSGGKSVMLANMAANFSSQGKNVLVVSVELGESLYAKRLDAILTKTDIKHHAEEASTIVERLEQMRETHGNITIKKVPYDTPPSKIRAIIMEYHIKYGRYPDVLIVDYLGICGSDKNFKGGNRFEADEDKAFSIRDLGHEYNMYVFTAGQINRDGYDVTTLGPQHVAGGISVINAADWAVGLVASEEDIDNDQVRLVQMKVRNSGKMTGSKILYRCPRTLRFSEAPNAVSTKNMSSPITKKTNAGDKKPEESGKKMSGKEKLRQVARIGEKR